MFLVRLFFILGFTFLLVVAVWAVVTITRMQRRQAVAMSILEQLAVRGELKKVIDKLQVEVGNAQVAAEEEQRTTAGREDDQTGSLEV
jgi:hypothetical protein